MRFMYRFLFVADECEYCHMTIDGLISFAITMSHKHTRRSVAP